jgi:N utilization substance protein A
VPDFQLSLAIGREGQNARLAARLTGWRIDIRPDTPGAEGDDEPAGTGDGAALEPDGDLAGVPESAEHA